MEEPGADGVKRQRIDSYGSSVRISQPPTPHHQSQHISPVQGERVTQHEYSGTPGQPNLRAPSEYVQHPPPSPYGSIPPAHHGPQGPTPPPPAPPSGSIPEQQQQAHHATPQGPHPLHYDSRPPTNYGQPSQERPPADTNPLHGVGNPSTTHSPTHGSQPALRPIDTSVPPPEPHQYAPSAPPMYPSPQHYPPQGHPGPIPPPPHPSPNTPAYHHGPPPAPGYYEHGQHPAPGYHDPHGPPYSAGPYPPPMWPPRYAAPQPLPPSKKGSRATQACETCRQRKAKCDEGKPTCSYCKETRATCVYKEMQPAKADRAQREIMDQLKKTDENYEDLRGVFNKLDKKVDKVEIMIANLTKMASFIEGLKRPSTGSTTELGIKHDAHLQTLISPSLMNSTSTPSDVQTPPPPPPAVGESAIKVPESRPPHPQLVAGHTVMANRLLHWRSIKELLGSKVPEDDYVRTYEDRKGLIRVYGTGQGKDHYDGAMSGTPSSPASSASDDGNLRGHPSPRAPTSQDYTWGDRKLGLPNRVDGKYFGDEKLHLGGLTATGELQLDKTTMYQLMDSYLINLHILHPFLDRARLRRMIDKVWGDYNPHEAASVKSPFQPHMSQPRGPRVIKRKHSVGGGSPEDASNLPNLNGVPGSPHLFPRISTVIVLLVMALGKICLYTDPLPGFAPETVETAMHPPQAFSPATTTSSPLTPSNLRGITGKRGSISYAINSKGMRKGDRNVDVVPGLAYFAEAINILGNLQGNELPFAQAYLLAALYTAQLAAVMESWTWINSACRVCCLLVRDPGFTKEKDKKRVDLTKFLYLACLQLESDILAELNLVPSGLQLIDPEGKIGVPSGVVEDAENIESTGQPNDILIYYNYQLFLRKFMNDWQRHLYPASAGDSDQHDIPDKNSPSLQDRETCESSLSALRGLMQMHSEIAWGENEEPATYINAARLRGKYYGAKYFIHRPFLRHALMHFTPHTLNRKVMEMFENYRHNPTAYQMAVNPPENMRKEDMDDWRSFQFLISCHECVVAAQKSTTAFDGVLKEKRLMVTNIFGTAHAQFGNMLVLSAVYTSPILNFLIDTDDMERLLDRTINFLRSLAPISTTLQKDCELLTAIKDKIAAGFQSSTDYVHLNASFGSHRGFV